MNPSIRKRRRDRHRLRKPKQKFALQFNFGGFNIEAKFSALILPAAESLAAIARRLSQQLAESLNQGNFSIRNLNPCVFNSGSKYLKCAVNPKGDCNTCQHYLKRC
ncbi:MAG: DUF6464 family protein [Nostoc sp.]|uniref:DUF6464 family protein n=1 Tax=Nostoc sp. TaxID=1180 RepID=UPI002FFD33F6